MLLGDPRQADQRRQSFNFSIVIHQSLDPTAQAPRSLFLFLHACMIQSSTFRFLVPTIERTRALETYQVTQSLSRSLDQAIGGSGIKIPLPPKAGSKCDASTRGRGNYWAEPQRGLS